MKASSNSGCVLFVDDEPNITAALKRALRDEPYTTISANSAAEALEILEHRSVDVVVSDERMPGMSGSEFLGKVRERFPSTARIILSGQADLDAAIRAINEGEVWRFMLKPCNPADLMVTIRRAMEHKKLLELTRRLLQDYERKTALLDGIERSNPGLTKLDLDDDGAILLDDEDPGMEFELSDLLREIETRLPAGRAARTGTSARTPWLMRVLFVDDEPNVLDSIRRQMRKVCEVHTASGGQEALKFLDDTGPVSLVVSDMRMPEMNGAELLTRVRELYPDTVRMILSGQADLESTITAVNEGHIFRFLTKPCSEAVLHRAVQSGIEQYQLVTTRKELLEKTLQGLVETLNDILGLTNPVARHRTARVRQYAAAIAGGLHFPMPWDLRLATLLSQIGCITLPGSVLDKLYAGTELTLDEQRLYARHPEVAAALVARIPQLGPVAAMIARQQRLNFRELPADVAAWDTDTTATRDPGRGHPSR